MALAEEKAKLRQHIWNLLEQKGIARFPLPPHGRIPNFVGAEQAAERLSRLAIWKKAGTIFANPDAAQQPVRELALKGGKRLIMASPKLKAGYLLIEPTKVKGLEYAASTIKGAFKFGQKLSKLPKAELVVTGSVAVDRYGWRLGKGGGYGDKEIARLKQEGSITEKTPIVTTVHDVQIVAKVPHERHDQPVSWIVTPTKVIRCKYI